MSLSNVDIIILCDLYGSLLTEKQRQMLRLFYDFDNSLSEIAEQYGITRQAVHDCIGKAEEQLRNFDKKLGLKNKFENIKAFANNIEKGENTTENAQKIILTLGE